jgi:hypothetical protein
MLSFRIRILYQSKLFSLFLSLLFSDEKIKKIIERKICMNFYIYTENANK